MAGGARAFPPHCQTLLRIDLIRTCRSRLKTVCCSVICCSVICALSRCCNSVFDRLKEFTAEGNRSGALMLELQGQLQPPLLESLASCGGAAAAASLLHEWTRSPHAFVDAVRRDLDCNDDRMVSKMEFRRWAKDGVLIAVLASAARARAATPPLSSDPPPALDADEAAPAAAAAPAPTASISGSTPAPVLPAPPPDCPFPQWIAYKPSTSKLDAAAALAASKSGGAVASDKIVCLKGPAFSDQCEERYQIWRSDMRACKHADIAGCDDASAELSFISMEIQGKQIGTIIPARFPRNCHAVVQEPLLCSARPPPARRRR